MDDLAVIESVGRVKHVQLWQEARVALNELPRLIGAVEEPLPTVI